MIENVNDRIKRVRKSLNLTMDKFGNKIGITKASVSKLESGENNPSEQTLKLICREFNVDYFWLTEGFGDMFIDIPDTVIDEMKITYDLSDFEEQILRQYLILSKEEREVLQSILKKMFLINEKNGG